MAGAAEAGLGMEEGGRPAVPTPINVYYCIVCSVPPEYCEYGQNLEQCRIALEKDCPELYESFVSDLGEALEGEEGDGEEKKKRQTRGGKGMRKVKAKKETKGEGVLVLRMTRNKRKFVTCVYGLTAYGIELKKASKAFASRFAASSSVVGEDEINIQGDQTGEIAEFLAKKFPAIKVKDVTVDIKKK